MPTSSKIYWSTKKNDRRSYESFVLLRDLQLMLHTDESMDYSLENHLHRYFVRFLYAKTKCQENSFDFFSLISYLISFEIVFYPDYPTNHPIADILYQNVENEQIFHRYILHLNLNIYTNKIRQNPHPNHVNVMEHCQLHVLNPNQRHIPNSINRKIKLILKFNCQLRILSQNE